jgi:hypothetical protein
MAAHQLLYKSKRLCGKISKLFSFVEFSIDKDFVLYVWINTLSSI